MIGKRKINHIKRNMNEILRDAHGRKIGEIERWGDRQIIRDEHGRKLGEYNGRYTFDDHGRRVGEGNLLTMLLNK